MSINNPIVLDLPLPIYTERLIIRPAMPGDGKEIFAAIEESRGEFKLWLPWVKSVKTWQDSEKTAREFYADFILRKAFNFVIIHDNNIIIGMCSFHDINWNITSSAIGYWCRTSATGNGFMQEAVTALVIYGFKEIKFKRQTILCNDDNIKSKKLAEELGFALETKTLGLIENHLGDALATGCMYARFNGEGLTINNIK